MKQLGRDRQVLAVTHLPQVAACADHHFVVSKQTDAGKTRSAADTVAGEARVAEIARMLGGEKLSSTSLAHAQEMLSSGAKAAPRQHARDRHERPRRGRPLPRGGARHRHFRLGQVGGAACARRRWLLLRRQPAAGIAARLPAPRAAAARPARRHRGRRAQRRHVAAPAAAAGAIARRRRRRPGRSFWTPPPVRWCGVSRKRGAPIRSPIAVR